MVTAIITAVRLELAIFLLVRVCVRKKDDRFDDKRENCCKFLVFWIGQMFWVWVCMLPIVFLNSTVTDVPLGAADYVGWALMLFGFIFQVAADVHKYLFKKNPDNKDKVCNTGLWSISRHPNYFGEIVLWWGVLIATIPLFLEPGNAAWWATIVSPLFTMVILLGGSGIPTAEGKNLARFYKNPKKRDIYAQYHKQTPPLIPFCPCWYEKLPMGCKAVCCCEFPCYQYKEESEDEKANPGAALLKKGDNSSHGTFVASKESGNASGDVEMPDSESKDPEDPEDPKATQVVTPKKSLAAKADKE